MINGATLKINVDDSNFINWLKKVICESDTDIYCDCEFGYWTQEYSLILYLQENKFSDLPKNEYTDYLQFDVNVSAIELVGTPSQLNDFLFKTRLDGYLYVTWDINFTNLIENK